MQILDNGTMNIDGSAYLYQLRGNKLLITARDMKFTAKFQFSGNALFTTINGNTNRWEADIPSPAFVCPRCSAPVRQGDAFCTACGAPLTTGGEAQKGDWSPQEMESMLQNDFGLTFSGNQWAFSGRVIDDMASSYSDPDISYGIIKGIRQRMNDPSFMFCIVTGGQVVIIINAKPEPVCFKTQLPPVNGVSELIEKAIKDGGFCKICNGAFLIHY